MKAVKRFLSQVPLLILWLMFSVLLWGFVFSRITETSPEKKITLYVDAPTPRAVDLAVALEERRDENVRMVKVHPFTYAMLDSDALISADLYIIKESDMETYLDWFCPVPLAFSEDTSRWEKDGVLYGIRIYDADTKLGIADSYIDYAPQEEPSENYYLAFGGKSLHLIGNENALDDSAAHLAAALLNEDL